MIDDLDKALNSFATDLDPARLAHVEEQVLARIRANGIAGSPPGVRTTALAAIGAILLGLLSSGPAEKGAPEGMLAPFGPSSPLAASAFLVTDD
ncbi:hypothetical protein DAH55_10680 [Sphingomonas koreensis]|uniref:hypothetical protein n=1 Tax=Sphingomonas koreensis TaxID=93064 RepID=UPI000831056D|nr:hypothetical protein [Sphingomonas koreensis]PJI87226.1 hypothetical protein BDW16_0458 [Sphingomonas koreensis]RSU59563.1 hypothetical protein DAH56_11305 [Sphingomonas koreensis]RSU68716.1 hypothetical protein DAH55_10680 [Sphingomonas koreensis]